MYKAELIKKRNYNVYQRNALIQYGRYYLTTSQQKTLKFLISKIGEYTDPEKEFTFSIREYCEVAGIKCVKGYYDVVRNDISSIDRASVWVTDGKGNYKLLKWFNTVNMNENTDTICIKWHQHIIPYLFFDPKQGNYTKYPLYYILPLSKRSSIPLYELLKSYCFKGRQGQLTISIDELKQKLFDDDHEKYERFGDFNNKVLKGAINQINSFTDIYVGYYPTKTGKKITGVHFDIRMRTGTKLVANQIRSKQRIDAPKHKKHISISEQVEKRQDLIIEQIKSSSYVSLLDVIPQDIIDKNLQFSGRDKQSLEHNVYFTQQITIATKVIRKLIDSGQILKPESANDKDLQLAIYTVAYKLAEKLMLDKYGAKEKE